LSEEAVDAREIEVARCIGNNETERLACRAEYVILRQVRQHFLDYTEKVTQRQGMSSLWSRPPISKGVNHENSKDGYPRQFQSIDGAGLGGALTFFPHSRLEPNLLINELNTIARG